MSLNLDTTDMEGAEIKSRMEGLERLLARSRHVTESIAITYLGQVGFLFQHRGSSVIVDPYLSYAGDESPDSAPGFWRRNYPPPIRPECLRDIDLVLCTHSHLDHTDPRTLRGILSASPRCVFAGPRQSVAAMTEGGLPAESLRTLEAGTPFRQGELMVEPVPAAHEAYEQDAEGAYACLGYVLRWAGRTFFHAGDTTPQEKLSADLAHLKIDVGFLPINGRSVARNELGIVGNMNAREAVTFAVRHQFGLLVPTHYDLYSNNGAPLSHFVTELEAIDARQCFKAFCPGEQILLGSLVS